MANKQRLIDVSAALEKVCENCCCDFEECKQVGFCTDYENINQLPTVDAVEVVRCINCRYYNTEQSECNIKFDSDGEKLLMPPDAYCSDGKRRKNDGK